MLPAEKKRGTSVRQWLPYRDGNRLTKVILGDVEVVLAKHVSPHNLLLFILFIYQKINIQNVRRQNESRWPTLVTEEDDRLAWVDFAGRRFAIVQTFDSGCGCYLWDAVRTAVSLLRAAPCWLSSPAPTDKMHARALIRASCCSSTLSTSTSGVTSPVRSHQHELTLGDDTPLDLCAFIGLRVVELGAGCGLVGLALAWLGAEVCLTDLYDQIVRTLITCSTFYTTH
jgi:hypothetical protein